VLQDRARRSPQE